MKSKEEIREEFITIIKSLTDTHGVSGELIGKIIGQSGGWVRNVKRDNSGTVTSQHLHIVGQLFSLIENQEISQDSDELQRLKEENTQLKKQLEEEVQVTKENRDTLKDLAASLRAIIDEKKSYITEIDRLKEELKKSKGASS